MNPKPTKSFLNQYSEYLTEDLSRPVFMTEEALKTLKKGYLCDDETPSEMYYRLAYTAAKYLEGTPLGGDKATHALFVMFVRGWLSPASPVAANFGAYKSSGKPKGAPASCYGVLLDNTITHIYKSLWHCAELSKKGGGLGVYFGEVLGITAISRWMTQFDLMAQLVSQGGVRRGAISMYTPFAHPELNKVLAAKDPHSGGDPRFKIDANIAVCFSDNDMSMLYGGVDTEVKKLDDVLKLRLKTGSPYITFTGNANDQAPQYYKDHGMEIKHSQLCLLPHERVIAKVPGRNGVQNVRIDELAELNAQGVSVEVFDGRNWVECNTFLPRGREEVFIEVTINNFRKFYTTYEHLHIIDGGMRVKAQDLRKGMRLKAHGLSPMIQQLMVTGVRIVGYPQIKDANGKPMYDKAPMTYCPTIETTHSFAISNGVLTGNCNEIYQYSDPEHSYVCVLSSLNLAKFNEWSRVNLNGYSVVEWAIFFLDAVIEELIVRLSKPGAPKFEYGLMNPDEYTNFWGLEGLKPALRSTIKGRALGLGTLGYHALLMSQMLPFESQDARDLNIYVHKHIDDRARCATRLLANLLGKCTWSYDERNSQLTAIAPTTTSSSLCDGGSAGIEPIPGNFYDNTGAKVNAVRKNRYLEALLEDRGHNTPKIWKMVSDAEGSVLPLVDLGILSEFEGRVFRTFREIDSREILQQAADRQPYLTQGQSLNLYYPYDVDAEKVVSDFFFAFSHGLKGLYYVRSNSKNKAEMGDTPVHMRTREDCVYCQKAKNLLTEYGIPYTEEYAPTGRVPQITYFGEYLEGGYEELLQVLTQEPVDYDSDCLGCEG